MLQSGQATITKDELEKRILLTEYGHHIQFLFGTITNKIYILYSLDRASLDYGNLIYNQQDATCNDLYC